MRVFMVLIALVAAPFLTGVAQASSPAREECKVKHANNGNHYGWRNGQHDDCNTPAPVAGSISGTVFLDLSYDGARDGDEAGIANWNVMLSGPVNGTIVTDAAGSYSFTGLPAGTYTVCESQRFGWLQTGPLTASSCTSGYGYTVVVPAGGTVPSLDFGNIG